MRYMQIQLRKIYQIVLTGVGLCLFAVALLLNHAYPRNQGIASLTHNALFQKLGISSASSASGSGLTYLSPLPKVTATPKADKLDDPTSTTDTQSPSLPTVAQAGEDKTANPETDDSISVKSNDKSGGGTKGDSSQPKAAGASRND